MEEYYKNAYKKNTGSSIIKVLFKIAYIILIMLVIINLAMLIQLKTNPDKTPSLFGIKMFCIVSGSMRPTIDIDDVIFIKEVGKTEIQVGDIISFTINGETITHRVIYIMSDEENQLTYITKGDANNVEDEVGIRYDNIEGKYISRIPKIGKIIIALQSKTMLISILIILIILYLFENHNTNKKQRRKREREDYENREK